MKKRIVILGSTGSIGTQTLEAIGMFEHLFEVVGLATYGRHELLAEQVERFSPQAVAVADPDAASEAEKRIDSKHTQILAGPRGPIRLVGEWDFDLLVAATSGSVGLRPTIQAIRRGVDVALANKETLVKAGHLVMALAREHDAQILPIDSEHNAIFQCLAGQDEDAVKRILITGSGGPFLDRPADELESATVEEALNHPRWDMGPKVTVDSATLMNKGFEIIEGHHLFGIGLDRIDVVIHPESICHSLVEFVDGSILAQLGRTDMRLPILNCLTWPERQECPFEPLDLCEVGALTFRPPDPERFPALEYAREAARTGLTMPAVLNAANEVAVQCFLDGRIAFGDIPRLIRHVMDEHEVGPADTLEQIDAADDWARQKAEDYAVACHH